MTNLLERLKKSKDERLKRKIQRLAERGNKFAIAKLQEEQEVQEVQEVKKKRGRKPKQEVNNG